MVWRFVMTTGSAKTIQGIHEYLACCSLLASSDYKLLYPETGLDSLHPRLVYDIVVRGFAESCRCWWGWEREAIRTVSACVEAVLRERNSN